jgi:acyl-homoserine-lactone acylase
VLLTAPGRRASVLASATLALAMGAVPGQATTPVAGGETVQASPAGAPLAPSDGVHRATIARTSHGIPHIVAGDYESLGFGNGFATAETSACVLADTLVTARGERSRWFGPDARYSDQVTLDATNLQTDALVTDLRNRQVVERLLADPVRGPGEEARALVRGYVAGVNQHLADVGGADAINDPACAGAPWVQPATELDLWYGVYLANLLASTGVFVPQIVDAEPPSASDPGLPLSGPRFAEVPAHLPSRQQLLARLGKDPDSAFGSNATALGTQVTSTGRGMLLGNPHFPWRGRYRFSQTHLTIPGEYDVAGAGLIGSPVVNIGWNHDVAWSHTVSTAYRFTPYEYRTLPGSPTTYLTGDGPRELERREVQVDVRGRDGRVHTVTEDMYRTDEGYVLDAPDVLMPWTPASVFALRDANAEHRRTVDVFHEMAKTHSVQELLAAQDKAAGMPWVNTIAADRDGNVLYADHSVVPNVPDSLVQQCATPTGHVLFQLAGLPALDGTRASGDCAWRDDADASRPGIFGPANLPKTVRHDWVMNANDSYWLPNPDQPLEGFARIIGCERCERSLRSRMVYTYVLDRLAGADGLGAGGSMSHAQLQAIEHENRVYGAELARENDDLQKVCQAADGGDACTALSQWDGRTDTDSTGAHVFREFFVRLPEQGRWEVPFDPASPLQTPRDLNEKNPQVVEAMRDAIAYLQAQHVPFDAALGDLQVAGDEGAPPIPLGGGEGETGNANVVSSRDAAANLDRLYPVSYGSSHIQAVAFTDDGVDAATILTYGLAADPTSPYSHDQTELFSQKRWVDFPFTDAEIRGDPAFRSYVVDDAG